MDICAELNTPVEFAGKSFCFTGRACMKRAEIAEIITSLDGKVHSRVTRDTDYLVVGSKGNKGWAYNGFGNKILRAYYLQAKGYGVSIIAEETFWAGAANNA